jgi:hypothetical protein
MCDHAARLLSRAERPRIAQQQNVAERDFENPFGGAADQTVVDAATAICGERYQIDASNFHVVAKRDLRRAVRDHDLDAVTPFLVKISRAPAISHAATRQLTHQPHPTGSCPAPDRADRRHSI